MGKVRINTIGDESLEQEQKIKAEKRHEAKSTKVSEESKGTETVAEKVIESKTKEKSAFVKTTADKKEKRSKKYKEVAMKLDRNKTYSLSQGVEMLANIHIAKFDETVELHINTTATGISGSVSLPHGTGKKTNIAILAPAKDAQAAEALLAEIAAGTINFDVLIATPDAMPKLAKFARILGPRGLMPNPKNGTVTPKPEEVAAKFASGQVNFKTESKAPVLHMSVGKLSFKQEQLMENIKIALEAVQHKNIKNITLKSTMSPGMKVQI